MEMGIWEFLWNPCVDLRTGKPQVLTEDEQKCLLDLDLGGIPKQREVLHSPEVFMRVTRSLKIRFITIIYTSHQMGAINQVIPSSCPLFGSRKQNFIMC
jgi:hypothetical protein